MPRLPRKSLASGRNGTIHVVPRSDLTLEVASDNHSVDLIFYEYRGSSPDTPFAQAQPLSGDGFANNRRPVTGFVDAAIKLLAGASLSGGMSEAREASCLPGWQWRWR